MPAGRPLKYKTVEELEAAIEEYFTYCDNKTKEVWSEKEGNKIYPDPEPYAMAGLAYAIGLDRRSLINYKERDEFFLAIKNARNRIEADVERRMMHKDTFTPGLIFNAKNNFDWRDKSEVDNTIRMPKPLLGGMSKDVPDNNSNQEDSTAE